ncbi:HAD family hydrolase [Vibrio sp. 10N.222.54.F12]|uniref:HAD family hydrolase n=1 Tax=Vibrio TaxID=662 RepID=UPI000C85115A|nr:HAD family hydrolase [Vibrio tasmaniensis]PML19196.1 hydrolase [Vibrio tasmaniensis]PML45531.1 hydrolase [Vibrio tasmaniensis]
MTKLIELTEVVLFDWGNTLMVDFPDAQGKMCDWEVVEEVAGAREVLAALSKQHKLYVATNAADSTEQDIIQAFERAGLSQYLSGYFCKASLGVSKYDSDFYPAIISKLGVAPQDITMVGDTLDKDIYPALEAGLKAVWLNTEGADLKSGHPNVMQVQSLNELLEKYHG